LLLATGDLVPVMVFETAEPESVEHLGDPEMSLAARHAPRPTAGFSP
jgi:hypothetical protein